MKIVEFLEEYKNLATDYLKEKYIKDTIEIKPYITFAKKVSLIDKVVKATTYEIDKDGNSTGNIKVNSIARSLLFAMSIIDIYTNLEVDFSKISEEYDLLQENHLFTEINKLIPESELVELQGLLDMTFNDAIQNNFSTQAFISGQVNRFGSLISITLKPIFDKIANELEDLDDTKVEKITKTIERVLKKIK